MGICIFYCSGRDSNIQMQQSGGLLLMPGSTGMTPLLPSIPGRQRKRVPSGVPLMGYPIWDNPFIIMLGGRDSNNEMCQQTI